MPDGSTEILQSLRMLVICFSYIINMGCKTGSIKCISVFNLIWSFIQLFLGTLILGVYGQFTELTQSMRAIAMPVLLIGLGFLTFIVGVRGCIGDIKKSKSALAVFVIFYTLAYGAGFACMVLSKPAKGQLYTQVKDELKGMINTCATQMDSMTSESEASLICDELQYLQSYMQCCGSESYKDWYQQLSANSSLPQSCCVQEQGKCNMSFYDTNSTLSDLVYTNGCARKTVYMIEKYSWWIFQTNCAGLLSQSVCVLLLLVVLRPDWFTIRGRNQLIATSEPDEKIHVREVELTDLL
ncbi:tetraspanin-36-like [Watersipora subatra]|uniref:tetraspanin-36-like n=1 Tax=Watersipora subatra TaxID=2589382 RepID=UPI00355B7CD3